ncbi:MAG: CAP domain-containing protein [Saprospiraceae bacterium]|nr:CAP domain-containing protein [Saprospiraceae bacterium]MCF8249699.1 CAP domain-containing protein [Saprospiraceae bacterium]MCF8279858.1 CAP domain-containing protein [Bacteroidales bacterium]MCF8312314.1 CAP domain-containing protein [Saprospiraceae bacterium]MCF8440689.1 CAP domain-containing protein [Saprospiraceae bacterium]
MANKFTSALLLIGFILAACSDKGDDTSFFPDAPATPDKVKLVNLVNAFRLKGETCGGSSFSATVPVTWNDTLATVARKHSEDMNANNKLNHTGSDGSFVDDRITASGYVYSFYAENLLKGGATEEEAIKAWQESAAHCENLMDTKINEIGVGTAGPYWTMVLASH